MNTATLKAMLLQYMPFKSKAEKRLGKEIVADVTPDRPLNGLQPRLVIVDEATHPSPIIDEDMKRFQREYNRRESLVVKRLTVSSTTLRVSQSQWFREMVRAERLEHACRVAFIYARLEPHGA